MQMGLRINGSGGGIDTSLGDTLAKALFGDPTQARQDALARSQLMNDEYNRRQTEAETLYNEQLKAAAAEKAARDAAIFNADTAAGPVRGRMIHDAQYLGDEPAPVEVAPSPTQPDLSTLLAPVEDLSSLNTTASPNTPPTPSLQPPAGGSIRIGGYNNLQSPAADALPYTSLDTQPVPVEDVLNPGEVVPNADGSATVGTRDGNVRLSREETDILGLSDAYKADAAGQMTKDAGTSAFIYDDNLNISPEVRAATLAAGGSVVGKDAAVAQDPDAKVFNEGEYKLRGQYQGLQPVQRFNVVNQRFDSMKKAAAQSNHGVGDTIMIYDAIKMADPTSSVMGGEQATAENAPGLLPAQMVYFNNLLNQTGNKFDDAGRQAFIQAGYDIWKTHAAVLKPINDQYTKSALEQGLKPENIITATGDVADPSLPPAGLTEDQIAQTMASNPNFSRGQAIKLLLKRMANQPTGGQ